MLATTVRKTALFIMGLVAAAVPSAAKAWGDLGHETVGQIAEEILKTRYPEALQGIHAVVGIEPLYISSTWPDQVRDDEKFDDFSAYHFIDVPVDPKKAPEKTAMTVLTKYPNLLVDRNAPREAKMIAFRYLVHVIGDVHQPLHAGNQIDRGGNACTVKWQPITSQNPSLTNLHSAWDTKLVEHIAQRMKTESGSRGFFGFKQLAAKLMEKHKDIVDQSHTMDVHAWISESREALKSFVYPDQIAAEQRRYCTKKASELKDEEIPVLDAAFVNRVEVEAERRIVLAGARLAAVLNELYGKSRSVRRIDQKRIIELLDLVDREAQSHSHQDK